MLGLFEDWLNAFGRMPADDAGLPVLGIAILAAIIAIVSRHRRTALETIGLALLALVLVGIWEFPALLVAVGALVNATHGVGRRSSERQLHALDRRIEAISTRLDGFLAALDRRTREVDHHVEYIEEMAIRRTLDSVAGFSAPQIKPNGKASEAPVT